MSGEVNYLERIFFFRNCTHKYSRRLQELLFEFEEKYMEDMDYFFIAEEGSDFFSGVINVETSHHLEEWFDKCHDNFCDFLDLKLVRVERRDILIANNTMFKMSYTYRSNPRMEEISPYDVLVRL